MKAGPGSEGLVAFLSRFWNYENSPYVRVKLAHGHSIGRRHCRDMAGWVRTCWAPFFKERPLADRRKTDLDSFSLWLAEERNLKAKSINRHFRQALLHFAGGGKRGILTEQEVKQLFDVSWVDERSRLGNILAMCTGLRAGEIMCAISRRTDFVWALWIRHYWKPYFNDRRMIETRKNDLQAFSLWLKEEKRREKQLTTAWLREQSRFDGHIRTISSPPIPQTA